MDLITKRRIQLGPVNADTRYISHGCNYMLLCPQYIFPYPPPIFLLYAGFMTDGFKDQKQPRVNALKQLLLKRPFMAVGRVVHISYSSPQSRSLPQTPSDNDVAYSITGVNTDVGGGRVESVDESVG